MSAQSRKILVADRDEIIVTLIAHILHRQGYSVDIAVTADEVATRLASHPYDAILLDVVFSRVLHGMPELATRTILLSAKGSDTPVSVHAVIQKPVEFQELIDTVNGCAKESDE